MTMQDELRKLLNVRIEIDGIEYPNGYADDLSIDRTDLDSEFTEHSERYAYYATLASMAEDRHERLKEDLEQLAARLDHEVRTKLEVVRQQDPKYKMTETMVENEVKMNKAYQELLKRVQDARHLAKVLKNAPMAFAHRRDMLIELAKSHMAQLRDPRVQQGAVEQVRRIMNSSEPEPPLQAPGLPEPSRRRPAVTSGPTGTLCSVCHKPQEHTVHGITCPEGHGGAPPLEDQQTPTPSPAPARRRAPRNA